MLGVSSRHLWGALNPAPRYTDPSLAYAPPKRFEDSSIICQKLCPSACFLRALSLQGHKWLFIHTFVRAGEVELVRYCFICISDTQLDLLAASPFLKHPICASQDTTILLTCEGPRQTFHVYQPFMVNSHRG